MKSSGSVTPYILNRPGRDVIKSLPNPQRLVSFTTSDSTLVDGFPTVPRYWARAKPHFSLNGGSYDQNRPNPTDIDMESHTRFIANAFDDFGGTWRPFYTEGADYFFRSPPGLAPHKNTVEYRIGKELFSVEALRFNPGDYLISSFNQGMDDARMFTFAMALIPDAPTEYTVLSTQNSTSEISVSLNGSYTLSYGGVSSNLVLPAPATSMVPTYLILSVNSLGATLTIATSIRRSYTIRVVQREAEVSDLALTIGKTRKGKATSTFNLIEANLYASNDNKIYPVSEIISNLSGMYGAS